MVTPLHAIHSIRNGLSPLVFLAQFAKDGDVEARDQLIDAILERSDSLMGDLDIIDHALRKPGFSAPRSKTQLR